ncbi:MAG TPA: bifunctional phosphoglucose/phosphomannose isomerase [Patescibacteria group bacterium]|jgi:glucose/mannose-6-phosphate isomerase|nr:bifunctional phosphoglucose/phosphomannose isomerase [Patescibacteria group bacterium]
MLDDLKLIHERDAEDALGIAEKQWQQLEYEFNMPDLNFGKADVDNIVFAGMGGSALGALLSQTWPGHKIPFEICRNYDIPKYVSSETLFVASSYSGNTEETLEALGKAEAAKAKIVVIASGGRLAEIAKAKNYPMAILPSVTQPRYATLYSFKAFVSWLVKLGFVDASEASSAIKPTIDFLKEAVAGWRPDVATAQNYAKQLALDVVGKSVVVYAGPLMFPAAYKWKISFNENAKNVAWVNQYPEFNHNEFIGWTSHPLEKPYAVIDLRSNLEHPRIQKRFEVSERLLSGRRPAPIVVAVQGQTILEQLIWTVALGDFVTIYSALLNGLNPTPVDLIEKFKKELG